MNLNNVNIGIDIEDISRFAGLSTAKDKNFLYKIFTQKELNYSYSKKNYAQHLAVRYCAKEAIIKSMSQFGKEVFYKSIEIVNNGDGAPNIKLAEKKFSNYKIKISLSHSGDKAIAIAIVAKDK